MTASDLPKWQSDAEVGRVYLGTPAYGGQVTAGYASCLATTGVELSRKGIPWITAFISGESLVPRARNGIAAKFLADEKATHLIFIDADIEWEPVDVLRLLGHDVEVICGAYPKKSEPITYAFHPIMDAAGHCRRDPRTGRIEIANAATGFLCIKREVFLHLIAERAVAKIEAMEGVPPDELKWLYDFFPAGVEEGIYWSEDYGFCRRWRGIGGEVWLDPAIKLNHIGSKTYHGDVSQIFSAIPKPKAVA